MRLAKGKQLWVGERRGTAVFTRGGREGAPGVPKAKDLRTAEAAQAWLDAACAKQLADGFVVVDADAGMDAPFTATGERPPPKPRAIPPRHASAVEQVRVLVRGGYAEADRITAVIEQLATDDARAATAARAARVRPGMTMDDRARDERVWAIAGPQGGDRLRDLLHDIWREELAAIARATPPDPDIAAAIERAFAALATADILALPACGFSQTDGWADVGAIAARRTPPPRGACFFHEQDLARAVAGRGLHLTFGAYPNDDAIARTIAAEIVAVLVAHGVPATWSGEATARIAIAPFPWFRRTPR